MNKKYFLNIAVILGLLAGPCHAAPSYGTKMPGKNQFHVGGQTHAVLKRDLEGQNGEMSSLQHFLLVSYGLTDWFSVDLKGGAGNTHQTPEGGEEISYPSYMAGGYGFRIRVYQGEKVKIVSGFQHISVHPYSVFVGPVKNKAVIDDWQLSFLASRDFGRVTPYMGLRWSRMDYIHWVEDDRNRVKSELEKSIGMIVGMDIPVHERAWLNFEGQFLDAQAVAASLHVSF
ncbi:MAG TPA: hypothetical protein PKV41_06755 [Candidatus Omnitrophota bacterium]|nr:hypothetical protein [Candidatus Omnitrophota bacterium]